MKKLEKITALDLFAGAGGWSVACWGAGIDEFGVELMDEALQTRKANGMKTAYEDVWEGVLNPSIVPVYDFLIASPPCQTFSVAGAGGGRRALSAVLVAIQQGLYKRPLELHGLTKTMDPRTALVLAPLAHIYREQPRLVALEQVPQVLPVWEAYATVMREWGYSVAVQTLNAEQYGVPQTRKRAILVARKDGIEAKLPMPTHSKYHSRDPKRLDEGVLPWVGAGEVLGLSAMEGYIRSNYSGGPTVDGKRGRTERRLSEPVTTITSKAGSMKVVTQSGETNLSVADALALQGFPTGFEVCGARPAQMLQIGNAVPVGMASAVISALMA